MEDADLCLRLHAQGPSPACCLGYSGRGRVLQLHDKGQWAETSGRRLAAWGNVVSYQGLPFMPTLNSLCCTSFLAYAPMHAVLEWAVSLGGSLCTMVAARHLHSVQDLPSLAEWGKQ
jgi:hypothetical protein